MKQDKDGNINITQEDAQNIVKSGRAKAGLVVQDVILPLEEINVKDKWNKLPKNFKEGLRIILPSVSNDYSRPEITCVSINKSYLCAGDGTQLTKYNLPKSTKMSCLIPGTSIRQLLKYDITHYQKSNND